LDEDSRRRLQRNPLRVLDSKNPAMEPLIRDAPKMIDHLDERSLHAFDKLQSLLRGAGLAYEVNPRLVRGLDYYNDAVYEWVTDRLGAQATVCAGGRYDGLFAQIGGKEAPACGYAMGVERLLTLMEESGKRPPTPVPDVYLVHAGEQAEAFAWMVAEKLRDNGVLTILHCGGGSFKSQMKRADSSGARYAVIIGDDEAAKRCVTLKALRTAEDQQSLSVEEALSILGGK
jgi:histidyl-tRNA synthetase